MMVSTIYKCPLTEETDSMSKRINLVVLWAFDGFLLGGVGDLKGLRPLSGKISTGGNQ